MSRRTFFGFSAFLLSALAIVSPLTAAERRVVTTADSDYLGFDLRTVKNVSPQQCEAACIGDNSCKAFTYNVKAQWCFLKSDYGQLNTFNGAIAGKIVEVVTQPDIGAPPALSFLSKELLQQARELKDGLTLGDNQQGFGVENLKAIAQGELLRNNADTALYNFKGALSLTPEDGALWIETARAASTAKNNNSSAISDGTLAAINGYQLSRNTQSRADALAVLAGALAKQQNYRPALEAYKASLALVSARTVQAAYNDLRERRGFRVTGNTVDNDSVSPRACVQFSEPLVKTGVDYAPFVVLDGQAPKAMEAKDNQICVEGLTHGQRYKLSLRRGLPSSVDEPLLAQADLDIYVKDRSATVRFTGDSFVLPSTVRRGIPLVSVNTDKANLKLYRIGDRNIASLLANSQFLTQMDGYNASQIESQNGELVWQGTIDIAQDINKDVVTSFPVDEAVPNRKPGVYVMTATAATGASQEWENKATQWFVVSDIGLTTYAGTDGLHVFARSLGSAKPMAGVDLQLLAKNNEILGTAKTDANGRATFTAGLMRGTAAMVPAVLSAQNDGKDYVFLDMTRAGFDLSDRGVTGRPAPGAIDILTWTERGIYRPGETVHASALARNVDATAIENLPLTFIFLRPDGVEDRRTVSNGALGGYTLDLPLQATSMRGTWTMQVFTDPKSSAIAEKTFLVDDFVPDRIEFDMTSTVKEIEPGQPARVDIAGRFLYGAPGAGLALEGEIVLKPTRENAAFPGYQFGLADEEETETVRLPLDALEATGEDGKSSFDALIEEVPSTTKLVNADIVVRMREAGGRAVERSLVLPVKADGPRIGIKPEFTGDLAENSTGNFTVIVAGADGKRQDLRGLPWKLIKIDRDYQWYREGSSWRFEPVTRTSQVSTGKLDVTAADGGKVAVPVKWGRYRLEVETADVGGPASSVEFDAGWFVTASSSETPDALEVALDKASYKVGDTAKLKVSSRYAGELMVTAGSEQLVSVQTASIGANGGEVSIPVTREWGAGSYVTATLFRPGEAQESRMPMRAIGITWLKVDAENRDLSVAITAPEKTLPRQPLDISLQVAGAGANEEAYVTVAAVDVGILNLTKYQPPAPDDWYFGQRRLGLEIRDIYGRLIDGSLGATGRLRTGGDGGEVALQSSPPKEKLVAFFSGPVKLDAQGKANVSFDIPQFNGTARVMAVAWSRTGVGHGVRDVVIRDPIVVSASLPRFLAPGDDSNLRLDIANTDAPAGQYQLSVTTNEPVAIGQSAIKPVTLAAVGKADITLPLVGIAPGDGTISIRLANSSGTSISQELYIPVRPAAMPVTERRLVDLKPGSSLTVDSNLLADSILQGASVSVTVSRSNAFDIPALLMSLDRYPYGCAEQTTSRALPLLYLSEMAVKSGLADDGEVKKRVQDAINRVLSYQSSAGSFGLWAPGGGDLWLDAYVSDFLSRAREQGYEVQEKALVQALESLQNSLSYTNNIKDQGNEIAYALYVLARNRKAAISDLRYYADTMLNDFPTPLAKAHIAAALSLYGDAQRSRNIFAASMQMSENALVKKVSLVRSDYGSSLRDSAAVLALAAESKPVPPIVPALAEIVAKEWAAKKYTSTQEQTWMLLAARALQNGDQDLRLNVNGAAHQGALMTQMTGDALIGHPVTVRNDSGAALSAAITTVAAPATPLPAGGDGFQITRTYYNMDGEEVNVSEAKQNERYVVVLTVNETNNWPSRIVVTDLLPAGLEIDNPSIVNSANLTNFDFIEEVTAAHTEFRNDRFVAAFDRNAGDNREITFAYVVRAVTPGVYDHPAAQVDDMYRPQFSARTATGKMEVLAAQ